MQCIILYSTDFPFFPLYHPPTSASPPYFASLLQYQRKKKKIEIVLLFLFDHLLFYCAPSTTEKLSASYSTNFPLVVNSIKQRLTGINQNEGTNKSPTVAMKATEEANNPTAKIKLLLSGLVISSKMLILFRVSRRGKGKEFINRSAFLF